VRIDRRHYTVRRDLTTVRGPPPDGTHAAAHSCRIIGALATRPAQAAWPAKHRSRASRDLPRARRMIRLRSGRG